MVADLFAMIDSVEMKILILIRSSAALWERVGGQRDDRPIWGSNGVGIETSIQRWIVMPGSQRVSNRCDNAGLL